ncbi:nucleotide-binding protein [Catenulispora yoronensis]|uniref:Nucleotide-binding protein n=1 Tax=Catenulispora yoronensis TaxID=450799 RepID=A0ABN2U2J7_9ACTN
MSGDNYTSSGVVGNMGPGGKIGTMNVGAPGATTDPAPSAPDPAPSAADQAPSVTDQAPGPTDQVPSDAERDLARSVFVVHGRDEQVRSLMFDFLRRLDLRPLEWEELVAATRQVSPYLGNVVGLAPSQARAAVVLLTPDDVVTLHPDLHEVEEPPFETELIGQARPNVLIELGLALAAYPDRTLIIEVGRLRPIADIEGRNVVRFDGSAEALGKIVERLTTAGCAVNDRGGDWRKPWPRLAAQDRKP